MPTAQLIVVGSVVLLIAIGIRAGFTVRAPRSYTRMRFFTWMPLAALVMVYVVADAVNTEHHWFGAVSMLLLLSGSTYDLVITARRNQ